MGSNEVDDRAEVDAIAWLEEYQESAYRRLKLPMPAPTMQPPQECYGVPPARGSKYDDPDMRQAMFRTALEVEAGLSWKPDAPPIIGFLPFASPRAIYVDHKQSGRTILVFHRGQFEYFHRAISALIRVCPIRKRFSECTLEELSFSDAWCDYDRYYDVMPTLVHALLGASLDVRLPVKEIVDSIFKQDRVALELDATELEMSIRLQDCLTAFVVGHEYGHSVERESFVVMGHHGFDDPVAKTILQNALSEGTADHVGIGLAYMRNRMMGRDAEENHAGIMLFYVLALFLQDFVELFRDGRLTPDGSVDSPTHPPLRGRFRQAQKAIRQFEKDPSNLQRGEMLAASFFGVLSKFPVVLQPYIDNWREGGLYTQLAAEFGGTWDGSSDGGEANSSTIADPGG